MSPQIDIDNVIVVACDDANQRQAAFEAVQQLAAEAGDKVQTKGDQVFFYTEWEPPFKGLKKLSKAHAGVRFTILSEAFKDHHWISKAEYLDGKGDELTLSRIDDEFPSVFEEIFGVSESAWEKSPGLSFAGSFPR